MKQTNKNGWRQAGELILVLLLILLPFGFAASNIVTSGVVGVNTADPDATLHINGSIKTTPANFEIVASLNSPLFEDFRDIYVVNNYAYTGSKTNDSMSIVDVSDPTNPIIIGTVTDTRLNLVRAVKVSGKYAYVAGYSANMFNVIDISDPTSPRIVGNVTESALTQIQDIAIAGGYAYVVAGGNNSFSVIDISDPTGPYVVGTTGSDDRFNNVQSVVVQGVYAYATSYGNDSFSVIDISDKTNPAIIGSITDATLLNGARDAVVSGRYAYVAAQTASKIVIIDISDPANPVNISSIAGTGLAVPQNVFLSGQYLYVTSYSDYLTVVDVSDPNNPKLVETIYDATDLNEAYAIFVVGRYAYVGAATGDTLTIVDIKGFSSPTANIGDLGVGSLGVTTDVDVGNNLYVHSGLNVGPAGILSQGDLKVTGKANIATPTMYLTSATATGAHNCDDNPSNCCATNYHMCTTAEMLSGGRRIETSGTGRNATPYNTYGDVDPGDDSSSTDCTGWSATSASDNRYQCNYTTSLTCSINTNSGEPTICEDSDPAWCCSN